MQPSEIYQSHLEALMAQRERYVFYLVEIQKQIAELKAEAKKENIIIAE